MTYGETIDIAIEMAREAIELYLESLIEHGEEIPTEEETLELQNCEFFSIELNK